MVGFVVLPEEVEGGAHAPQFAVLHWTIRLGSDAQAVAVGRAVLQPRLADSRRHSGQVMP